MKTTQERADRESRVRAEAFRLLFVHYEPVGPDELAAETGIGADQVIVLLGELDRTGRVRRDDAGMWSPRPA